MAEQFEKRGCGWRRQYIDLCFGKRNPERPERGFADQHVAEIGELNDQNTTAAKLFDPRLPFESRRAFRSPSGSS